LGTPFPEDDFYFSESSISDGGSYVKEEIGNSLIINSRVGLLGSMNFQGCNFLHPFFGEERRKIWSTLLIDKSDAIPGGNTVEELGYSGAERYQSVHREPNVT